MQMKALAVAFAAVAVAIGAGTARGDTMHPVLGAKLAVVLAQLPPSFAFDEPVAVAFFAVLRARFAGHVAFEPRHASWFTPDAESLLLDHRIARVAADPAPAPAAAEPGGWSGLTYFRLHGSPRRYFNPLAI